MKYVYAVELYKNCKEEASLLFEAHLMEVGATTDVSLLAPDEEQYEWMCKTGRLHIVTVRLGGELVGYHASCLRTQLHRKNTLSAFTDAFYIKPEHRKGMVGYKLFTYVTETLKRKGVKWQYTGVKLVKDVGAILERQGHTEIERLYLKIIQE